MNELEECRYRFSYDKTKGILLWKNPVPGWISLKGKEAGWVSHSGYRKVNFRGKACYCHRIIWLLIYGRWPISIDHIDHNPLNNVLKNLREVRGQKEQAKNFSRRYDNKSGVTGVFYDKNRSKWMAYIKVNYKRIHLGRFTSKEDAIEARKKAEAAYGFHTNHGRRLKNAGISS